MKTLKKVLGIVMILALVLSVTVAFTACGKDKDGDSSDGGTETPGTETPGTGTETPGTGTETPAPETPAPETPAPETPDAGDEDEDEDEILASYYPYTIVVRDDKGNSISGAQVQIVNAAGELGRTITTDASGVVTFQVAPGDWKAQLLSVPAGYVVADYSTKYAFTNYVANIVVAKPAGYIFNAKDDEGAGIEGLTVTLYPDGNFNSEVTYYAETNQYGQAVVDAPAGVYTAVVTQLDEVYYIANIAISYTENKFEYNIILDDLRGTEGNPYSVNSKDYTAAIPANTAVWFTASYGLGAYIYVADSSVTITYNGIEYKAKEGEDFVKVALDAPSRGLGNASFSISAPEAKTALAIQIVYPEGHINNPIVTDISIFDELTAGIEILKPADMGSIDATAVYYSWTPDFDGDLVLVCDDAAALINITNNTTSYQATTMEGTVLAVSFSAGDEIIISIAYGQTGNGTATITAPTTVYANYKLGIFDIEGEALVGATIYISGDIGTVSVITDVLGNAIVRLPVGVYSAETYDAPAGYKATDLSELVANEVNTIIVYEFPSTNPEKPTSFIPSETRYDGLEYMEVDLAAGRTLYFHATGVAGTTLVISGVNADTTANICSYDMETGEWTVISTVNAVYSPSAWANVIVLELPEDPTAMMPFFANSYFTITTGEEDCSGVAIYQEKTAVPGQDWDNAIDVVAGDATLADVPADGAVYYKYVAGNDGYVIVTSASTNAAITVNNYTRGIYGDRFEGVGSTAYIPVFAGDEVEIQVGTADWLADSVSFTLTFTGETNVALTFDAENDESVAFNVVSDYDWDENGDADSAVTATLTLTNYSGKTLNIRGNVVVSYNGETYAATLNTDYWYYELSITLVDGVDTLVFSAPADCAASVTVEVASTLQ